MRVITGAIGHETSTFTTVATIGYLTGDELISKFRGSNTTIGGIHRRCGSARL